MVPVSSARRGRASSGPNVAEGHIVHGSPLEKGRPATTMNNAHRDDLMAGRQPESAAASDRPWDRVRREPAVLGAEWGIRPSDVRAATHKGRPETPCAWSAGQGDARARARSWPTCGYIAAAGPPAALLPSAGQAFPAAGAGVVGHEVAHPARRAPFHPLRGDGEGRFPGRFAGRDSIAAQDDHHGGDAQGRNENKGQDLGALVQWSISSPLEPCPRARLADVRASLRLRA